MCAGGAVGRDVRPAAHLLSFASPKESRQRKGDPTSRVPFAALRGNLRCSVVWRHCGTHFAPAALRSDNRNESVHEAHASCGACARPTPCAPRHAQRGGETTRAIAALGLAHAAQSARALGAERSDGPYGLQTPCGCACGAGLAGWRVQRSMHALRRLTRRGCLNGAPQARSEFCGAPRKPRDAGLPRSAAKGSQTWGRLSLVPFFGETKKGTAPPGAHPGQQRIQPTQHDSITNRPLARANQAPSAIKTTE